MRTLFILVGLLVCGTMRAYGEPTWYAASGCEESATETGAFDRSEYRITRNGSGGTGLLLCPIPRRTCDASGTAIIFVYVQDQHTSNVVCWFSTRDHYGNQIAWHSDASIGGPETLTLGLPINTHSVLFVLKCRMPVNGASGYTRIHSYKFDQLGGC